MPDNHFSELKANSKRLKGGVFGRIKPTHCLVHFNWPASRTATEMPCLNPDIERKAVFLAVHGKTAASFVQSDYSNFPQTDRTFALAIMLCRKRMRVMLQSEQCNR